MRHATLLVAALSGSAFAQTGSLTWQANDGAGWTSGLLLTDSPAVRIRLLAEWQVDLEYAIFGFTRLDGRIITGHEASDTAADFASGFHPFNRGPFPTPHRLGNVLKLDDHRDTLPPGEGPRWAYLGQAPEGFEWVTRDNPLDLVSFTLTFDGVPGPRVFDSIHGPITGGNTIDRVMSIYTDWMGNSVFPLTTLHGLEVVYVPSPSGLPFLLITAALRRRR